MRRYSEEFPAVRFDDMDKAQFIQGVKAPGDAAWDRHAVAFAARVINGGGIAGKTAHQQAEQAAWDARMAAEGWDV